MDAVEVGKRIKYFREKRGYTKNKLSELAGVSPTYIYQIENGEKCPTVEYLDFICFALGITLSDFFFKEFDSENQPDEEELISLIKNLSASEKSALLVLLKKK